jgi:hypothetical protein
MSTIVSPATAFLRDLGDGLIMRRAAPEDTDALLALHTAAFPEQVTGDPIERLCAWTSDLMSGKHPTFRPGDFVVVVDTKTGDLVSSLNLISQRWTYDGIEFGVGRPELVCTRPAYRNRGLVRAQFATMHEMSAQRGELVQAITGIPYYYRQFGYEMAMNLGGFRAGPFASVPPLPADQSEPFVVRPAEEDDLPFVRAMVAQAEARSLVACVRDDAMWRYELTGRHERSTERVQMVVIFTPAGDRIGLLIHPSLLWHVGMGVTLWELVPGVSWLEVAPSLLRYLKHVASQYAAEAGRSCPGFALSLGAEHPAYNVLHAMVAATHRPYAWYLRVADLPAFVVRIASALERRLAESPAAGYTGELKLSFYRDGLHLVFENGRLIHCTGFRPLPDVRDSAGFPGLTFLQLLFGYRSLEQLRDAFPDCWVEGDTPRVLLEALFPRLPSHVWGIT